MLLLFAGMEMEIYEWMNAVQEASSGLSLRRTQNRTIKPLEHFIY
jgi:hypothetical protein